MQLQANYYKFNGATSVCHVLPEDPERLACLAMYATFVVAAAVLPIALDSLEGHLASIEIQVKENSDVTYRGHV